MKKIGILTYVKEYSNLGTNMQSYCTLNAIQKEYSDDLVELIDYSAWGTHMKPYLSNISFRSLLKDSIRFKKYNDFFKNKLKFSSNKLVSSDFGKSIEFIKNNKYDAIYVGSDTVLELQRASKDNLTAFWLDDTINAKKFLIAASSHNVVFDSLTEKQKSKIQRTINDFSLLGVRDEPTYRLLSNFIQEGDERLQIIPDPTFTYEIDYSFIENYIRRKKLLFNKPIVCLHLLRETKWASAIANIFRKEGYVIASLRPAYYADMLFTDLSPFEQLGIYKYFDLVITHRFHDSIFCFKNLTPVIFFPEHVTDVTLYHESKALTLFKSLKLDKTNYIENKDKITAKNLFEIHQEAISNFKLNEIFIRNTLVKNKEKYESFVKNSKKIFLK
jgi:hypothetical protein